MLLVELQHQYKSDHSTASEKINQLKKILDRLDLRFNIVLAVPLNLLFLWNLQQAMQLEKWKTAKGLESETMFKARILAKELGLKMKVADVDYQGDKTKATFYYTAENRVDFRELIKQMAESFNIRIEMRQISKLEEASRLGGIGICGREFCYSAWLTDFRAGAAFYGRNNDKQWSEFKCCLTQESKNYKPSLKDTDFNSIETLKGIATLQKKMLSKG